ncbi:hypothetical protein J4E85_009127 [Alternaria conjuncta]|uniref:uncharacterized protein n=1 Tax=Alternaria conjuncta TaxID=181017 RepID=UPI00221F2F8B|nr:uncharacterized protein J4E85_009127 [Alternaria conjuncta]KAI4921012.1 hypothetical protein J4E85_009127 [Alternaria conjuncta]
MGRFYNPFSPRRSIIADAGTDADANAGTTPGPTTEQPQSKERTTAPKSRHAPHPSVDTIPDRLDDIKDYVRGVSSYIQWLQGLTEHERSNVTRVTEIKRELKSAHRDLEKLDANLYCEIGDEIEALVKDAKRHAWRSYKNVVKLEERLRGPKGGGDTGVKLRRISGPQNGGRRNTSTDNGKVEAYVRGDAEEEKQAFEDALDVRRRSVVEGDHYEDTYLMSGGLPVGDIHPPVAVQRAGRANAFEALRQLPRLIIHGAPSQCSESLRLPTTHPLKFPQPRDEVKLRVQEEEANMDPVLRNPYKERRGSCNGFMITEMTMQGIEDARFVLPYLHYMKLHELRAIKEWLSNAGFIASSGSMSRMEKALLCIQLLQTGCRYETLAVIHSRSPRQVMESCNEVMRALLQWHRMTVDDGDIGDQAEYIVLWGIWHKYVVSDGRAGLYFGFDWTCLAKVLVALNVYMGRWRMQGKFAMDGPAFAWGKFFVPAVDGREIPDTMDGNHGERNDAERRSLDEVARRGTTV